MPGQLWKATSKHNIVVHGFTEFLLKINKVSISQMFLVLSHTIITVQLIFFSCRSVHIIRAHLFYYNWHIQGQWENWKWHNEIFSHWSYWQGICLQRRVQLVSNQGEMSASASLFVTEPWWGNTCSSFSLSNQTGCSASVTFCFILPNHAKHGYILQLILNPRDKTCQAVWIIVEEVGGPIWHTNAKTVFHLTSLCSSCSIHHLGCVSVTFLLSYHTSNEGQVWAAHAQTLTR